MHPPYDTVAARAVDCLSNKDNTNAQDATEAFEILLLEEYWLNCSIKKTCTPPSLGASCLC